mmetsp:Transcript_17886/g.26396  ORF Transcript_17886/g.26396 Transcript_17886/m.26396 type:complete len:175 (-) Transcript_17886:183-707(-)|eukprot:CAMPEP_0185023062 /NCGR_PEP_ID=MMETSP1103-20130426/5759_1 /TAXON_ID=36769 /ORGANISM="Paraphysomonas bandaiensis, Strain Caron Lab Isolate" /LENGTH=174 /DNA_ID=CAMNT_0027555463 /DNA_START=79 /DNA_END=603 /DNA_ORIENTATION=+
MFFLKKLRRDIQLEPIHFGPNLKEHVKDRVRRELLGSSLGKHGYVIEIIEIADEDIIFGLLDNDSGAVNVTAWYSAILLRPFPNEVLDAVVVNATESGFFASVGPLVIFVSRHAMTEDIRYDYTRGDCWCSDDQEVEIREGSVVRLRIMGITVEAGAVGAVGTIKDNYLGHYEE